MCKITVPQQSFLSFECLDFPKFADLKHLKSLNIDGHISLRVETNWKYLWRSSVDFPDQATFSENLNLCWHNQLPYRAYLGCWYCGCTVVSYVVDLY